MINKYKYKSLADELRNIAEFYKKNNENFYKLHEAANALDFVATLVNGFSTFSDSILSVLLENEKFKTYILEIAEDAITSSIRQDD